MSAKATPATAGDTRLTKVFVGGLAWETKKDGLQGYFERFGEILEAVVIFDRSTNRSKGYGFVSYSSSTILQPIHLSSAEILLLN
jgi:RNA recognition motif-containing protein